ncbi:MAG: hypothetical protein WC544_01190 [Patescibacteria group bacterium]
MVTREFVLKQIDAQARWRTLPVLATSTFMGRTTALILVEPSPFNVWVPLEDMDENDFAPRETPRDPAVEQEIILRYPRQVA